MKSHLSCGFTPTSLHNSMGKPKRDITGARFGRLVVVKYYGNSAWECICDCGNTTVVKTSNLTNGHTTSCGCKAKEQSVKNGLSSLQDLTGKRFGKLTAMEYDAEKKKWKCKCDCGNTCYISQNNLCRKKRNTSSCGCIVNLGNANDTNIVGGTNVGNIRSSTVSKRSSTGIKGVYFCKSKGKYVAHIGFRGKQYTLCTSSDINECIAARKEAEKRIFVEFLEWYEKEWKNEV